MLIILTLDNKKCSDEGLERGAGRGEGLEGSPPLLYVRRIISYPSSCEAAFLSYKNHNTLYILTRKWLKCTIPATSQPELHWQL
jgi:hypothetical protein